MQGLFAVTGAERWSTPPAGEAAASNQVTIGHESFIQQCFRSEFIHTRLCLATLALARALAHALAWA